jgi:GR25 family glycosyltransferase involved in LPS biosynthesis/glycosyltransferase involved in cell wall biosynthesis
MGCCAKNQIRILFYIGYQTTPLKWDDIHNSAVGGSESSLMQMANMLSLTGEFKITITGNVVSNLNHTKMFFENTEDLRTKIKEKKIDNNFDYVIAINYIHYLLELDFINYKQSIFWLHNTEHFPWYNGDVLPNNGDDLYSDPRMNLVVCVSEWQRNVVQTKYPQCAHKIRVIPNGIDHSLFNVFPIPIENQNQTFIYSSAPDRGLEMVLHTWPQIKSQYPESILKVFCPQYSIATLQQICEKYDAYNMDGVDVVGPASKGTLYNEMHRARYWLYPSIYEETFCNTAVETMFSDCFIISTNTANLKDLLPSDACFKCDVNGSEPIDQFILNSISQVESEIKNTPQIAQARLDKQRLCASQYKCTKVVEYWKTLLRPLNTNKLFQTIYVITLRKDIEELRKKWDEELKRAGIVNNNLVIISGVDGTTVDDNYLSSGQYAIYPNWRIPSSVNTWWNRDIKPGELGCAISHHYVWVHADNHNYENIVVFEDDFVSTGHRITNEILNDVPCDWDMLYLGRNPNVQDKSSVNANIVRPGASYNMHSYALSRSGIKKLLQQNFDKILMPVDEFIQATYTEHPRDDLGFIWRDNICYAVKTDIFKQSSTKLTSTTENIHLKKTLHPELFTFFENQTKWCSKYLMPGIIDMDIDLLVDEPLSNVFSFPLFNKTFCTQIIEQAESINKWTTDRHVFYPTTDMLLSTMDFDDIYTHILRQYIEPIIRHVYKLPGDSWHKLNTENFIARYTPDSQPQLKLHHDSSDISALLNLSQCDVDYTGGGTYFPKYKTLHRPPRGYISIHPGCITHQHGARPVTSGSRYIIVSFMKRSN